MGASGTVCGGAAPLGGQPCRAGWAGGFRLLLAPLCRHAGDQHAQALGPGDNFRPLSKAIENICLPLAGLKRKHAQGRGPLPSCPEALSPEAR